MYLFRIVPLSSTIYFYKNMLLHIFSPFQSTVELIMQKRTSNTFLSLFMFVFSTRLLRYYNIQYLLHTKHLQMLYVSSQSQYGWLESERKIQLRKSKLLENLTFINGFDIKNNTWLESTLINQNIIKTITKLKHCLLHG